MLCEVILVCAVLGTWNFWILMNCFGELEKFFVNFINQLFINFYSMANGQWPMSLPMTRWLIRFNKTNINRTCYVEERRRGDTFNRKIRNFVLTENIQSVRVRQQISNIKMSFSLTFKITIEISCEFLRITRIINH